MSVIKKKQICNKESTISTRIDTRYLSVKYLPTRTIYYLEEQNEYRNFVLQQLNLEGFPPNNKLNICGSVL